MAAAALFLVLALLPGGLFAGAPPSEAEAVPGRYIVVVEGADPAAVAEEHRSAHGAEVRHVYREALRGYAAVMSEQAAERIAADPRVAYLEADGVVTTAHHQCGHSGGPPGSSEPPCDPGDVFGTVTESSSGEGIEGATVVVEETDHSATTDGEGDYLIENVEAGTHTVTAQADGYETASQEVTVDGDTQVDFALQAESSDGDDGDTADGQIVPWGVERIGADGHSLDGQGIHVYIIDTGIDATHPDLQPNLGEGNAVVRCRGGGCDAEWDDDHGHGTHVAGTAGAVDDPATNVVGVAPGATLHAVKVLSNSARGFRSDVIAGIDWVAGHNADQARVANMSLGGSGSKTGTCLEQPDQDGDVFQGTDSYHEAICNATHAGVVFAVAAGNSGADATGTVPAAYDDTVITVSALQCDLVGDHEQTCDRGTEDWPDWSNWGDDAADWTSIDSAPVAVTAPGVSVLSAWPDGETHVGSGTSMAAPHAAGAAALFLDGNDTLADRSSFDQARADLLGTGEDTGAFSNTSGNPHYEPLVQVGE